MKLIPSLPKAATTASERKVFGLLRDVSWGPAAGALSGLDLAEHEYKKWGEIDFLLVGPPGVVVIEVKGGAVSCVDGVWTYEDRLGRVVRRSESPVAQASSAFFSVMKNYLGPQFPEIPWRRIPTGFCVIFAGASRESLARYLGGPELHPAITGTREDLSGAGALARFLEGVMAHWREQILDPVPTVLRDESVGKVLGFLRPSFERVQPLSLTAHQVRQELVELTDDQYSLIDAWAGASRLLCKGPAGCGKTLLAVEILRRALADGRRVVLVTGTEGLAKHLRASNVPVGAQIVSFEEMRRNPPPAGEYDLLIIDEGQLLVHQVAMSLFDDVLVGGLVDGQWVWFGDPNYQPSHSSTFDQQCMARLEKLAYLQPMLRQNCRNTPQVVAATELASGVPPGHARVRGRGPAVEWVTDGDGKTLEEAVAQVIREWRESGAEDRDIVLLYAGVRAEKFVATVAEKLHLPARRWALSTAGGEKFLAWDKVEEFRGLESPFVILSGLDELKDDAELQGALYLGMTRANVGLSVATHKPTKARIQDFMKRTSQVRKGG